MIIFVQTLNLICFGSHAELVSASLADVDPDLSTKACTERSRSTRGNNSS